MSHHRTFRFVAAAALAFGPASTAGVAADRATDATTHAATRGSALSVAQAVPQISRVLRLFASDGADGDLLGLSVAMEGDFAVVGAPADDDNGQTSGSAYVFRRDAGGTDAWGQVAKLVPVDGETLDWFGVAVAISGRRAIVGAEHDSDNGTNAGAAYVFRRETDSGDRWSQTAALLAADGAAHDNFGSSVALAGDIALVGAGGDDDNGDASGSAYVFRGSAGEPGDWEQVAKLVASDGMRGDDFGRSVAISGNSAIVGARTNDRHGEDSGATYVFERHADGPDTWAQTARLSPDDAAEGQLFGSSVAISGDYALVGAQADSQNGINSGAAYVFHRHRGDTSGWGQTAKLLASDGSARLRFGRDVSISGRLALIGASGSPLDPMLGSAYAFYRSADSSDNWDELGKLQAIDGSPGDWFGEAVAVSGHGAIVGAYGHDDPGVDAGSATIYSAGGLGPAFVTTGLVDAAEGRAIGGQRRGRHLNLRCRSGPGVDDGQRLGPRRGNAPQRGRRVGLRDCVRHGLRRHRHHAANGRHGGERQTCAGDTVPESRHRRRGVARRRPAPERVPIRRGQRFAQHRMVSGRQPDSPRGGHLAAALHTRWFGRHCASRGRGRQFVCRGAMVRRLAPISGRRRPTGPQRSHRRSPESVQPVYDDTL